MGRVSGENSDRDSSKGCSRRPHRGSSIACCSPVWPLQPRKCSRDVNHLQRLPSHGIGYRSFTGQYLNSCGVFKDAVLSILAIIATQERTRLGGRTIARLEKAKGTGWVGGRPRLIANRATVAQMDANGMTARGTGEEPDVKN